MLSDADLSAMRAQAESAMPETVEIRRKTEVGDGAGGFTEQWSVIATVSGRIAPTGSQPQERVVAEKLSVVSPWTVTLPAGVDVTVSDRLVIGGRTLEAVAVLAPRSWEISRRVLCAEVV